MATVNERSPARPGRPERGDAPRGVNPYAPPAGDDGATVAGVDQRPTDSRGLRIGGAVALLLIGLWSTAGGGCSVIAGQVIGSARNFTDELSQLPDVPNPKQARAALEQLGHRAGGMIVAGVVILAGGVLCAVAGALLILGRGGLLGYVAATVGAVGEILFFALVAFNTAGLLKLAFYGFGAFASSQVRRPPRSG